MTIYPTFNEDRAEEITVELENNEGDTRQFQVFKKGNSDSNLRSINSNVQNTSRLIRQLYRELEDKDLLAGPEISGRNGEEFRVDNTRIHYRYATNSSDAIIDPKRDFIPVKGSKNELVGLEGSVVSEDHYSDALNDIADNPVDK